jgi:HlyD family secretion protein
LSVFFEYFVSYSSIKLKKMASPDTQSPTPEQTFDIVRQDSLAPIEDFSPQTKSPLALSSSPKFWMGFFLALTLVGSVVGIWQSIAPSIGVSQTAGTQQRQTPPKAVETVSLKTGSGVRTIQLLGQVEATERSTIRAQTGGVIEEILVREGDRIRVGQTIANLDDSEQQLLLAQAEAELAQERSDLARLEVGTRPEIISQRKANVNSIEAREKNAIDNLKRTSNLVKQGALSQRALVEAQTTVDEIRNTRLEAEALLTEAISGPIREEIEAQRANVNAAIARVNQTKLQRTKIVSKSSGVVQTRHVSKGDLLETADEIVTLIGEDKLDIFLELPENTSGRVTEGMTIDLTARALPQWKQRATVTAVVPATDTVSRRQRIRIRLDNPPSGLLAGMAISGNLLIPDGNSGFVISRDALTRRQDKWYVFSIEDGKAKQHEVSLVSDLGDTVTIESEGLQSGREIVIRGGDGLQDGATVKVVGK